MNGLELRRMYRSGLKYFHLSVSARNLLKLAIEEEDRAERYEEAIRADPFFTSQMIGLASSVLKNGSVKSLAHAVTILGKEPVRAFVLGHSISRLFEPNADENFISLLNSHDRIENGRVAEASARNAGSAYLGSAFAAGYIYDIFRGWLTESQLAPYRNTLSSLLDETWRHSMRTGILGARIASEFKFSNQASRSLFALGLLHDVGRLGLAFSMPERFVENLSERKRAAEASIYDDSFEIPWDEKVFSITHSEVGSLILLATGAMGEWEELVDCHHAGDILKIRNAERHQLHQLLGLSERLATWYEHSTE